MSITTEQQAARRHKEIKGTTVTRTDHHTANREDVTNQTPYETEPDILLGSNTERACMCRPFLLEKE